MTRSSSASQWLLALVWAGLLCSRSSAAEFDLVIRNGRVIDGIHTGEGFSMAPATYGKRAYIVSNGGRFYSIHVEPPI